jgi:hypothetical protein
MNLNKNNEGNNPRNEAIKRTIELRKEYGGKENEIGSVDFFFYSDEIDNALDLMNKLKKLDDLAECVPENNKERNFLITGMTTPMPIKEEAMIEWFDLMERLADSCGCKFDG